MLLKYVIIYKDLGWGDVISFVQVGENPSNIKLSLGSKKLALPFEIEIIWGGKRECRMSIHTIPLQPTLHILIVILIIYIGGESFPYRKARWEKSL